MHKPQLFVVTVVPHWEDCFGQHFAGTPQSWLTPEVDGEPVDMGPLTRRMILAGSQKIHISEGYQAGGKVSLQLSVRPKLTDALGANEDPAPQALAPTSI